MNTNKLDLSVLGWFATLAVVLVFLFGLAALREGNREWMVTQRDYADIMLARHEKAVLQAQAEGKPVPPMGDGDKIAIRQLMLTDLKRVDRCTTCHLGIEDKSFTGEKQPFNAHPDLDMITVKHPTDKFGCTSCHSGQGMGTSAEAAHGFVHKWDYPMLGDRKDLTKYVQASCAQCHTDSTKWAAIGAPKLARGKQIVQEKNCASCHKFGETGGNIGPELTFEGDKVPEQFNFEHLKASLEGGTFGEEAKEEAKHIHHDIETWHKFHFKNPQAVSSGSVMPAFGFSDEDTEALVTYMLSLKATTVPVSMMTNDAKVKAVPIPAPKKVAAAAPAAKPAGKVDGKQAYEANCASCHQANGQGLPGMFPPFAGAEIPNGDPKEHIEIVLKGKSGPMTVLGKQYNGAMPPFSQLSDEEIAAIITYERTSWGNKGSVVTADQVKALR